MKKYLIFLFLAFTFSGTIFGQMPQIGAGVSKELAKWRAENYSDVKFKLDMTLEKMSPTLRGAVEISLFNKADLIILDWRKLKGKEDLSKLTNLSVNGKTAYFEEIKGHLVLKEGVLKNKSNAIRFDFTTPVADDAGIKRFVDKADGAEYVYSQFSADKNTPFPVFDQPDLKARFTLTVNAPVYWKVISNEPFYFSNSNYNVLTEGVETLKKAGRYVRNKELSETGKGSRFAEKVFNLSQDIPPVGRKSHYFYETKPIGTYVFAFAAGEFAQFTERDGLIRGEDFPPSDKGIESLSGVQSFNDGEEIRNYSLINVRKSQAEKFKRHAAEVFRLNRKKYESAKLDIILLPEIFNVQSEYDGIKFVPESSVFK